MARQTRPIASPTDRPTTYPRAAQKKRQARERLVAAAGAVIAERGTEGLTLREIAERADIGFGSFYNHFATKDDLIAAVVTETVGSLAATFLAEAAALEDPAESSAMVHRWFIRLAYDRPETAWLIVHLERADALFQSAVYPDARRSLERGMEAGRYRELDVEALLAVSVGATISVMRGILEGRLGPDADVASAEALLCAFGVDREEAARISRRPLPGDK